MLPTYNDYRIWEAFEYSNGEIAPKVETIERAKLVAPYWFKESALEYFKIKAFPEIFGHNAFIVSQEKNEQIKFFIYFLRYGDLPRTSSIILQSYNKIFNSREEAETELLALLDKRGQEKPVNARRYMLIEQFI